VTRDEIMELGVGRYLDALVAEKVMGWTRVSEYRPSLLTDLIGQPPDFEYKDIVPSYSAQISAAWAVICLLENNGWMWRMQYDAHEVEVTFWDMNKENKSVTASGGSFAPLAICRAALLAVGGTE
jgi:hypothetical protein